MPDMPESQPPIDFRTWSLPDLAKALEERRLPPVESWNPAHCGHSAMRIARDGTWFHEGRRIDRPAMVRLFSTVLRREADGSFVLVTPAEKLTIDVDLAPFVATAMKTSGSGPNRQIAFKLNTGDAVILGPEHPLRVESGVPLISVRRGLDASLARPVYYELADIALAEGATTPGVWSNGAFFPLDAS